MVFLCLAFLGTRLTGMHFHVSEPHNHRVAAAMAAHADHHEQVVSHATSDTSADHFTDHTADDHVDVKDAGLLAKPAPMLLAGLLIVLWVAFALHQPNAGGRRVPIQWLRPPPLRRWPNLLLPPSRGPPRAV